MPGPEDKLQPYAEKVANWLRSHSETLRKDEEQRLAYIKEHGQPPPSAKDVVAEKVRAGGDRIYDTFAGHGEAQKVRETASERSELMRQERELHPDWYTESAVPGVMVRKDPQEIRRIQVDQAIAQLKRAQEIQAKQDRLKAGEQTVEYAPKASR